jgi:hypothetical protein
MADSKDPLSPATRYVVLWHSGIAEPHFDLMFETLSGSELATWRSPVWPIVQPTSLTRLKDHRRVYLDYEGDLTHNRGHVKRIESGECMLDVGENARWTIEFADGHSIVLKLIADDEWQASSP